MLKQLNDNQKGVGYKLNIIMCCTPLDWEQSETVDNVILGVNGNTKMK